MAKWEDSGHGKATIDLETDKAKEYAAKLKIGDPMKSDLCLSCHVTAHGVSEDRLLETFTGDQGIECEVCHGPQGHGDGPAGQALEPRPGNLAELQTQAGDDFLFWRIREGKPGTSMVAWKGILTKEQIWQTVSFIRSLKE